MITRSKSSPNITITPRSRLTACARSSWLLSPRDGDKEDPFSLTGFFPSSIALGGTEEAWQEWGWLRTDEGHQANGMEAGIASDALADAVEPLPTADAYDPSLAQAAVEELMRKTIKEEDKLGVLSWGAVRNPFVGSGEEASEDRLFSPYMNDEPEDHEALYLSLSARRALQTRAEVIAGHEDNVAEASLFLKS